MKIRTFRFLLRLAGAQWILLFLFVFGSAWTTSAQRSVLISGRAVDEYGRPLAGAEVTLYTPPCSECIDQVLPSAISLSVGEFVLSSGGIALKNLQLFIQESDPPGFWSPFKGLPSFKERAVFKGTAVRVNRKQSRIDLGDVRAGILYAKVIIDLKRAGPNEPDPVPTELAKGRLSIRDSAGNIIYEGEIPKRALDMDTSSLKLALTRRTWTIEISLRNGSQPARSFRRTISLKTRSCIVVSLWDRNLSPSCE